MSTVPQTRPAVMTYGAAKKFLEGQQLRFGDPEQVEAVQIIQTVNRWLEMYDTMSRVDLGPDCPECDGDGSCPHCGTECNHCDGTGILTYTDYERDQLTKEQAEKLIAECSEQYETAKEMPCPTA